MEQQTDRLAQEIEQHHKEIEAAEQNALAIDERLRAIPGLDGFMQEKRGFGQVRNPWQTNNVTAQAYVAQADRQLATWLASKAGKTLPGVDYEAQAAKERMEQAHQDLLAKTAVLREQRLAREQQREHARLHGQWSNAYGKLI